MSLLGLSRRGIAWSKAAVTPAMWQMGTLFSVDMVTNVTDYAFHLFLGVALTPGDFAVVQSINSLVLIMVQMFGVMQPVVARLVAQHTDAHDADQYAIFQRFFWQCLALGALLLVVGLSISRPAARWLNVPTGAVVLLSVMALLTLVRPVVAGMLQGRQQFLAFGATRTTFAIGRLSLALLLVGLLAGGGIAAVGTIPAGFALSIAAGLLFVGRKAWQRTERAPAHLVWDGWRLSLAALVAFGAFMSLQSLDLIWVNRLFPPQLAGSYATAAVLRRVLAVLPGAAVVILYPRIVATVKAKRYPDRMLAKTAVVIGGSGIVLTLLYFLAGEWIVATIFNAKYSAAGPLLGWMGVAMLGYGLASIWLNLFLATKPWPFVILTAVTAAAQAIGFTQLNSSLEQILAVFSLGGWLLALGGGVLYVFWLRPRLHRP